MIKEPYLVVCDDLDSQHPINIHGIYAVCRNPRPIEASAPVSVPDYLPCGHLVTSWRSKEYRCSECVEREASAPAAPPESDSALAKEALAQWMIAHSFATGHGETFADLLNSLEWQVAELRNPAPKDQTQAIDEAVRVVDGITCAFCEAGCEGLSDTRKAELKKSSWSFDPNKKYHDAKSMPVLCEAQGRAIVTAILPILRGGK